MCHADSVALVRSLAPRSVLQTIDKANTSNNRFHRREVTLIKTRRNDRVVVHGA